MRITARAPDFPARRSAPAEPAEPMQFLDQACGNHLTTPEAYCGHCQQPVHREDQVWVTPWRMSTPFPLAEPVTPEHSS